MKSFGNLVQILCSSLSGLMHPLVNTRKGESKEADRTTRAVVNCVWNEVKDNWDISAGVVEKGISKAIRRYGQEAVERALLTPVWRVDIAQESVFTKLPKRVKIDPMVLVLASCSPNWSQWMLERRKTNITKPINISCGQRDQVVGGLLHGVEAIRNQGRKEGIRIGNKVPLWFVLSASYYYQGINENRLSNHRVAIENLRLIITEHWPLTKSHQTCYSVLVGKYLDNQLGYSLLKTIEEHHEIERIMKLRSVKKEERATSAKRI